METLPGRHKTTGTKPEYAAMASSGSAQTESVMEIITRAQARERGLPRYFTGKPCSFGHVAERNTTSRNCIECLKTRHAERKKEYKAEYSSRPDVRRREYISREVRYEVLRKKAFRGYLPWSSEDVRLLMKRDKDGGYLYKEKEIAIMLGRSIRGVNHKRMRIMLATQGVTSDQETQGAKESAKD